MSAAYWLKARSAQLGWHLWGYWFHYAFAAAVAFGLSQGGLAVVGMMLGVTFLAIPVALLQVAIERRFFSKPAQPGDIVRDPRTGRPVVNPGTGKPYRFSDEDAGAVLVNPATGALMVGGMAGVDVLGNPFGVDLTKEVEVAAGEVLDGGGLGSMGGDGMDVDYSSYVDDSSGYGSSDSFDSGSSSSGID